MKRSFLLLIFSFSVYFLFAQNSTETIKASLNWFENPTIHDPFETNPIEIYGFENAVYQRGHPTLPYFNYRFPVSSKGTLSVEIINAEYANLDKKATEDDVMLKDRLIFNTTITKDRNQYFANLRFIPIIKNGTNNFEKVTNVELNINFTPSLETATRTLDNTFVSKLSDGDIYKIAVSKNGVYKLSYDFLKNTLGISNLDNIDPRKIQVLGNGGGMLPEENIITRFDDLEENAIMVQGEGDGTFDSGDFIIFYGEESGKWKYDSNDNYFSFEKNLYDDRNFYFIKIGPNNGKRISSQASLSSTAFTTTTFDAYAHHEDEFRNLLHEATIAQGAGRKWYGDIFSLVRERDYNNIFSFENRVPDSEVIISSEVASRSSVAGSSFKLETAGEAFSKTFSSVSFTNPEGLYARENRIFNKFSLAGNTNTFDIKVTYTANGNDSKGWLDFITMNTRKNLAMTGNQMTFRDKSSLDHASTTYQLSNANGLTIWDISNPLEAKIQEANANNGQISFGANSEFLKEFVAFDPNSNLLAAEAVGKISNQNLHALDKVDMLIIYTEEYAEQAQRLRDHRASHDNLSVELARLDQVYNEFSSGRKDVSAIRDMARMVHQRTDDFKYLLIFGSGSFDFKNTASLNFDEDLGLDYNIIPAYETVETLNPLYAYPSDDFFALLSEDEGDDSLGGDMDVSVGRIPFKNLQEANTVVDKIIHYDTSPATLGDWRLRLSFNGDDGDGGVHSNQANTIADSVLFEHPIFNINKIYFDAFQQIATPGGERFPEATEAINQDMFKGVLVMNYLVHGGGSGWAQERVLRRQHIMDWDNFEKLPLLVTATCSFTGYDEPDYVSAGELSLLNDKGGVIGLFTTVRAVFSSQNFALTRNAFQDLFDKDNGVTRTMGEVIRVAKNRQFGENTRKFALIGDPSQKLALPKHQVVTTKINGNSITSSSPIDTIGALQEVTIEGQILDNSGNLMSDFNGKIFPTIFDKPTEVSTLGQDGINVQTFSLQKNIIFKGAASVTNGLWKFTFVVPKDINYTFGQGKISYYAHDEVSQDASGFYDKVVIGGTNSNAINDDQPPLVEVFMNSENFVFGGITDENPVLLVKLSDDNGINVVGNSIGHDLTGVLDENTQSTYQLNKVRAWDIANNSAEGYTEFIVAKSAEVALSQVLNYPNPFMENTSFQFEHNLADQVLDVQIRVFTVGGRLVKTIQEQVMADGNRITDINWDGKDDFGDDIARGVYLYKVTIGGTDNTGEQITAQSEFEKLVILK